MENCIIVGIRPSSKLVMYLARNLLVILKNTVAQQVGIICVTFDNGMILTYGLFFIGKVYIVSELNKVRLEYVY